MNVKNMAKIDQNGKGLVLIFGQVIEIFKYASNCFENMKKRFLSSKLFPMVSPFVPWSPLLSRLKTVQKGIKPR